MIVNIILYFSRVNIFFLHIFHVFNTFSIFEQNLENNSTHKRREKCIAVEIMIYENMRFDYSFIKIEEYISLTSAINYIRMR